MNRGVAMIGLRGEWQTVVMIGLGLTVFFTGSLSSADKLELPPAVSRPVDFARDVQPILQAKCLRCHGPDKQKGSLRLDVRADAVRGGDNFSPAIVSGRSADSPLIRIVAGAAEDLVMPPEGARLTNEQIGILRAWIDQGAKWSDDLSGNADARKNHWSFQPVVRPPVPQISDLKSQISNLKSQIRNPIDNFVLARLKLANLDPNKEADRRTLIRRVSFDLIGLPPSPEEVERFVADADPQAYEKLVDRLLASPRYGERWARHWLDVVRFAESDGFETNRPRLNAWPYRDYVIRSFNDDKPYDQFVREQIAGDSIGADEATAFLVAGPVDRVKSPDPVLTAQQRADELHDMVATTGSTFLGLTVGCARCHAHKFDPVSQVDYYAMTAVFSGVQHGERPVRPVGQEARLQTAAELRRELQPVEIALEQFEPLAHPDRIETPGAPPRRMPVTRGKNIDRFPPVEAAFVRFTILETSQSEPCLDELEVLTAGEMPRNVALASAGAKATASSTLPGYEIHKLEHVNDGRFGNSRSWISNEPGRGWVTLEFAGLQRIDRVVWSRDRDDMPKFDDRVATKNRIEVSRDGQSWQLVASSDDRLPYKSQVPDGIAYSAEGATPDVASRLPALLQKRRDLQDRIAKVATIPVAYAGQFVPPTPTHRLHRGDPLQKREPIAPGGLSEFGTKLNLPPDATDVQRRLALANWITDVKHPLTARVLVNRLWHYHFGQGIVNTPSDFGINGARPSHPELLDWLASEFVARGWSVKAMQRVIVTSATYRQSSGIADLRLPIADLKVGDTSQSNPQSAIGNRQSIDSSNRLLWRFPPRRLEAESLRDTILAVSGNLNLTMGGPGFDLFEPNENYVKVYTPRQMFGPDEWRRMVYQSKPRMQLDSVFGAFDCPDAGQIAPRRNVSTTPLQALNLLNSRFIVHQSDLFAERLQRDAGDDAAKQIQRAFAIAFGRPPTSDETSAAIVLVRDHGWAALCRALFNANEFVMIF
jgi:mono/diheme cytochrome c family protein